MRLFHNQPILRQKIKKALKLCINESPRIATAQEVFIVAKNFKGNRQDSDDFGHF